MYVHATNEGLTLLLLLMIKIPKQERVLMENEVSDILFTVPLGLCLE